MATAPEPIASVTKKLILSYDTNSDEEPVRPNKKKGIESEDAWLTVMSMIAKLEINEGREKEEIEKPLEEVVHKRWPLEKPPPPEEISDDDLEQEEKFIYAYQHAEEIPTPQCAVCHYPIKDGGGCHRCLTILES